MIEIRHQNMDTSSSTQAAYNRLYHNKGILQRDSFYLWLIALLEPQPGRLLVDISCGQGRLVILAQQKGLQAVGIDFAEEAVRMGAAESAKGGWVISDGELLPLKPKSVDYVTHIGSLEHYQKPEAGMSEIARILKPEGVACILLPNSYGMLGNIKHVCQTGQVFDDGQPLQRYNTPAGWREMLINNGLLPYKLLKYEREWPLTRADLRWYLTHPTKFARLFTMWLIPTNLANCLVYICRRNPA
jgi:SAM-dependent methyltransferase